MKLTKGVLSYTLRGEKAEIELIYISCLGKKDTIRVLEIPSHINGKEVDYIHKRLIYNFEHYFPSLKKVVVPNKLANFVKSLKNQSTNEDIEIVYK